MKQKLLFLNYTTVLARFQPIFRNFKQNFDPPPQKIEIIERHDLFKGNCFTSLNMQYRGIPRNMLDDD